MIKHKVFISYHHEKDENYKIEFEKRFGNIFINKSVQDGEYDDDLCDEYIKRLIRQDKISDCSVVVVLIGAETYKRKHVDWEIYAGISGKAGGRSFGYKGIMPGVLEEILIAIEKNKPLFLLGGFGGITSSVCKIIKNNKIPDELTLDWQLKNNVGYDDLLKYYQEQKVENLLPNYNDLNEQLSYEKLNNGLTREENERLFETPFIEEAICLVMRGLKNLQKQKKHI